jgi:hypothetical protein
MKRLLCIPGLLLVLLVFAAGVTGCPTGAGEPASAAYPDSADSPAKGEADLTLDDLVGSKWIWPNLVLTFTTGDIVELSSTSSSEYLFYYRYVYDTAERKGSIVYDPIINERTPENPANLGSFTINPTYSALIFAQYKDYPHGANFERLLPEQ